jgi:hypothetical protein
VRARPRSWPRNVPHSRHKLHRKPRNNALGNNRGIVNLCCLPTSNLHHRPRPLRRMKAQLLRSARHGCQPMQAKTPVDPPG